MCTVLALSFVAGQAQSQSAAADSARAAATEAPRSQKNPAVAWSLSLLTIGGGQVYNGQWRKGAAFVGGALAGVALVGAGSVNCAFSDACGAVELGTLMILGSWVWAQIDAPLSARAINRRRAGFVVQPRVERVGRAPPAGTAAAAVPAWGVSLLSLRF